MYVSVISFTLRLFSFFLILTKRKFSSSFNAASRKKQAHGHPIALGEELDLILTYEKTVNIHLPDLNFELSDIHKSKAVQIYIGLVQSG